MHRPIAAAIAHGLAVALCVVSATTAGAQPAGSAPDREAALQQVDGRPYACVDPADVTARRWLQHEPCRLPMFHLPVAEALAPSDLSLRSSSLPARPEREPGHAMFWRLPVQPRGPYEAPRNSWR